LLNLLEWDYNKWGLVRKNKFRSTQIDGYTFIFTWIEYGQ